MQGPITIRGRTGQAGLTLLEMLIALSLFALIGVASYQVLAAVVSAQRAGDEHSAQLATVQKTLAALDRDLQQPVRRPIRSGEVSLEALQVNRGDYPLELTRGGWDNPLLLPRAQLQRVAYDIGPHPMAEQKGSPYAGDETLYLRRHFWTVLDRNEDSTVISQALMPGVEQLSLRLLSDQGPLDSWPPVGGSPEANDPPRLIALELRLQHPQWGAISRVYPLY